MFRIKGNGSSFPVVFVTILSIMSAGCGGSSSTSAISAAQAQAVTGQLSLAASEALSSAFGLISRPARGDRPNLAALVEGIQPDLPGCTPTPTGETCDFPVSFTAACPASGTISVTGDFSGTVNNPGDGSILSQVTLTPANCGVSDLVINGDPSVTLGGQINVTNSGPVYPITLTEIGAISYGPSPSDICQYNVTYTIASPSCTITGMVCGQPVSLSCQTAP